jgi:DNA-binding transcriptional ArsR family regulator
MVQTHPLTASTLQAIRQRGSVASAAELQAALGVSQPTVSRALTALIQSGQVLKVGSTRHQRYVVPRTVTGVGQTVPIMRIDVHGQASPFARMVLLEGGGVWLDEADGLSQKHDGLPWFLNDMRPQGFIGRTFAYAHPELHLGADPGKWNDDDVLRAMVLFGEDLPGNLIVGETAFARFHTLPERASRARSEHDYPAFAERAMQGTVGGSSAGGEQPKFCTIRNGQHVLVKFSPAGDSPTDQRTRDLLVCEHLALQTLAAAGLPAAQTQLFTVAGRVFLESVRFDRPAISLNTLFNSFNPQGLGRQGMVSLQVYDAEYIGNEDNWAATAERMQARGLMTAQDARHLCFLEAFGQLIANTDRHYGNISLLLEGSQNGGDWTLSPTYDMLPMFYAPMGGELVQRDFVVKNGIITKLQPTSATLPEWPRALALAIQFWQTAAADERISAAFRAIAAENCVKLA